MIYVTFACMMGCSLFLGILLPHPFFIALFFWWLLLALIMISRGASQALCRRYYEKRLAIEKEIPYAIKKGSVWRLILLIALPFYYVWFGVTFLSCMSVYAMLILDLPILTLSLLTFGHVFPFWRELTGRGMEFWGTHIGVYILMQILGWLVRVTVLGEFYGA